MIIKYKELYYTLYKTPLAQYFLGMDISTFMADALGVDVHIFNMDDGNLYDLDVSTEIRHSPEYSSPVINVFFADQHYQALVGKDIF